MNPPQGQTEKTQKGMHRKHRELFIPKAELQAIVSTMAQSVDGCYAEFDQYGKILAIKDDGFDHIWNASKFARLRKECPRLSSRELALFGVMNNMLPRYTFDSGDVEYEDVHDLEYLCDWLTTDYPSLFQSNTDVLTIARDLCAKGVLEPKARFNPLINEVQEPEVYYALTKEGQRISDFIQKRGRSSGRRQ